MYFMIGTGVFGIIAASLANETWKLHKKLASTEKVLDKRTNELAVVIYQREKNKENLDKANESLDELKGRFMKSQEEVFNLRMEKANTTEEITTVKETVSAATEEINSLKIENEILEKKLAIAEEYHNKANAEIKRVEAESAALNRNINLILNGPREVRRDFVKNGMKNIELYR